MPRRADPGLEVGARQPTGRSSCPLGANRCKPGDLAPLVPPEPRPIVPCTALLHPRRPPGWTYGLSSALLPPASAVARLVSAHRARLSRRAPDHYSRPSARMAPGSSRRSAMPSGRCAVHRRRASPGRARPDAARIVPRLSQHGQVVRDAGRRAAASGQHHLFDPSSSSTASVGAHSPPMWLEPRPPSRRHSDQPCRAARWQYLVLAV